MIESQILRRVSPRLVLQHGMTSQTAGREHLGPGRLNRLWSATNTAPARTAGRDHQPGSAARSQACRMPAATLAPHGDSTSTSGAYARTCTPPAHLKATALCWMRD